LKEKLIGLILLQDCDNKISRLESLKRNCPVKIKSMEDELNALKSSFQADTDRLESLKKERRISEQTVQELESRKEKSQIKLSNIKSNKEYTAALKEIEDLDREKTKVEDGIILLMEEIENCEKKCRENKNEIEILQKNFDLDKKRIEGELDALNSESSVLEKKREELASGIEKGLLSKYNFLKSRKQGVAIASVIGGVCQMCHLNIPPQLFYELIRCNEFMNCPNCNRLMYWGEDELFAKATGNTDKQPE